MMYVILIINLKYRDTDGVRAELACRWGAAQNIREYSADVGSTIEQEAKLHLSALYLRMPPRRERTM